MLGAIFIRRMLPVVILPVAIGVLLLPYRVHAQATPTASPQSYAEFGRVESEVDQVRQPNCGTLVVRGEFRNPYGEPVDGIRLIFRLRSAGKAPRELDRIEVDVPIAIGPGESAPFRRELSTGCTTMFHDLSFVAFASRRGAADLPVPDRETELAASEIHEGSALANVPLVNQPGAILPNFPSVGH